MLRATKKFAGYFTATIAALAALIAAIYGVQSYIDWRIEKVLDDPKMLRKISVTVRPEMIIDSSGSVLVDIGAMDYIDRITVAPSTEFPQLPGHLILTPKRYMAHAPLVTSIDAALLSVDAQRTNTLDWAYSLSYGSWREGGPNRLRIEILDR